MSTSKCYQIFILISIKIFKAFPSGKKKRIFLIKKKTFVFTQLIKLANND